MAGAQTTLKGVVHGKTIELEQEPALPDGQSVVVTLQPLEEKRLPLGEGIRRSAGAGRTIPRASTSIWSNSGRTAPKIDR